jgi:hypothetical protein
MIVFVYPPLPSLYSGARFLENSPTQVGESSKFENSQNWKQARKEKGAFKKHESEASVVKKPLQWDVLIGSIGQCPANCDRQYPALKLSKGNVDGIRKKL